MVTATLAVLGLLAAQVAPPPLPALPVGQRPAEERVPAEPSPPAPDGTATVSFGARSPRATVRVEVEGRPDLSCQTPCVLSLPAGPSRIRTSGVSRRHWDLVLQPGATEVVVEQHDVGNALLGAGLVFAGGTATFAGLFYALVSETCAPMGGCGPDRAGVRDGLLVAGGGLVGIGLGVLAIRASGRDHLEVTPPPASRAGLDRPGRCPRLELTALAAVPVPGGALVGLSFRF